MNVEALRALYRSMHVRHMNALRPTGGLAPIDYVSEAAQGGRLYLGEAWPREHLSPDELLLSSLDYACSVVARYAANRGIYVPQLDPDMMTLEQEVVPFRIEGGLSGKRGSFGYHFRESREGVLTDLLTSSSKVGQELLKRITLNLYDDLEIPDEARVLACGVLWGSIEIPSAPASRPSQAHRDILLVGIASRLKRAAGYAAGGDASEYSRGERPPIYGCTIAAAALSAFQTTVDPIRAFKINEKARAHLQGVRDVDELLRPAMDINRRPTWDSPEKPISEDQAGRVFAALAYLTTRITGAPPKSRRTC